jgi:hypothetical protein
MIPLVVVVLLAIFSVASAGSLRNDNVARVISADPQSIAVPGLAQAETLGSKELGAAAMVPQTTTYTSGFALSKQFSGTRT